MELNVYREGEEITDPETGRLLGREKDFVGIVQIIGVEKEYSQVVPIEANTGDFRESDTGEFLRGSPTLAVAGITNLNGDESPYGMLLSEQIIGTLKQNPEVKVVERKHLGQILRELAIEKFLLPRTPADATRGNEKPIALKTLDLKEAEPPEVPDNSLAEKLRMIKGADAVIVGTVADVNGAAAVNLRVVDTSTAAVLYSTHKVVGNPEKSIQARGLFGGIAESDEAAPEETSIETVKSKSRSETDKGDLLDRILRAIYSR
jgi:TolB-like protein